MRRVIKILLLSAAVALVCAPKDARADAYVSPFVGVNFNNNSGDGRGNYGVDVGWMGKGIAGLEADIGYAPNFFGGPTAIIGGNHILTAMGNLIVGMPVGGTHSAGVRPYFTIGVGLIETRVDGAVIGGVVQKVDTNNVGMDVGGGVMGFVAEHVGIRGDVRYIINFNDNNNTVQFGSFHFWRASVGVVLR